MGKRLKQTRTGQIPEPSGATCWGGFPYLIFVFIEISIFFIIYKS